VDRPERTIAALAVLGVVLGALVGHAQPGGPARRIGVLSNFSPATAGSLRLVPETLRELGYVEGRIGLTLPPSFVARADRVIR
jgi:hypothetical protein